jgi:hypothetical protein
MVGTSKCPVCGIVFKWRKSKDEKPATYCKKKCMNRMVHTWNLKGRFKWDTAPEDEKIKKLKERFEKYVVRQDGCWDWKGCLHKSGYAPMNFYNNKQKNAHIVSWILHNGDIPDSLLVLHKCDNHKCTNPEHLFLGTHKSNTQDMLNKKRNHPAFGETHTRAKLTTQQVREIKNKLAMGVTMKRLCDDYNMSKGAMYALKHGITWKHVII